MRVLLLTQPGPGWLAPFVILATALEDAGHDVAFGSAPSFLPAIEHAGFEAYPVGLDWLHADPVAAFPETANMDEAALDRFFRLDVLAGVAAAATFGDLTPLARTWQADLLVHDASEMGTPLAAEATRLPHATIGLTPVPPRGVLATAVRGRLDAIRVDLGLLPDPELARLWPTLLTAYPASFEAHPPPVGSRV